jgi:hypothetical protein
MLARLYQSWDAAPTQPMIRSALKDSRRDRGVKMSRNNRRSSCQETMLPFFRQSCLCAPALAAPLATCSEPQVFPLRPSTRFTAPFITCSLLGHRISICSTVALRARNGACDRNARETVSYALPQPHVIPPARSMTLAPIAFRLTLRSAAESASCRPETHTLRKSGRTVQVIDNDVTSPSSS